MARVPSSKLQSDICASIQIAKAAGIILDATREAMALQMHNRAENLALEDIVQYVIEEASRNDVAVEISDSELAIAV
jgi:hypothetical protein